MRGIRGRVVQGPLRRANVRGEAFLSDVDIAVDLEPKWERASKEFEVQSKKRVDVAQAKGKRFSNIVEYLYLTHPTENMERTRSTISQNRERC